MNLTPELIIALATVGGGLFGTFTTLWFRDRQDQRSSFRKEVFELIDKLQADVRELKTKNDSLQKEVSDLRVQNAILNGTNEYLTKQIADLIARTGHVN